MDHKTRAVIASITEVIGKVVARDGSLGEQAQNELLDDLNSIVKELKSKQEINMEDRVNNLEKWASKANQQLVWLYRDIYPTYSRLPNEYADLDELIEKMPKK